MSAPAFSGLDPAHLAEEIARADERIRPVVRETPLLDSESLGALNGGTVLLKHEGLQRTGSFKLRGAMNRLLRLTPEAARRGVVAASSGNHGAAVAYAARALSVPALVFVPEGASAAKVDAIRGAGAVVEHFGTDGLDTEIHARAVAAARRLTYVSPYNDPDVVAGQGTLGCELRRQAPALDAVIIAVGGGGLIAGVAADLATHLSGVRVIGASPARSAVMARSVRAGRLLELPSEPTLSDGTAGGVEPGAITFSLCRALVHEWVEVEEGAIAEAMRHCLLRERVVVEGAAGVAVGAFRQCAGALRGARVAVVLCGANVSADRLRSVLVEAT